MLLIIIYLCIIASVILIYLAFFGSPRLKPVHIEGLTQERQTKRTVFNSFLFKVFPTRWLLEKLKINIKIKNRLDASHVRLAPQEFFNLKVLIILALGLSVYFAWNKAEPYVYLVVCAIGFILPEIWLNIKISKRKYEISRVLPETVDLLGLCVEGGLDFTTAITWIIDKRITNNPLLEELAFVTEEVKWGKSRSQALKDMARRLNIIEVSSFVQTLVQAERMGTPVAEAFTILSEDTRLQRFNRGERYAFQAPIKILIPLIFFILPVIGIIVAGPVFLQFIQGGLTAAFK